MDWELFEVLEPKIERLINFHFKNYHDRQDAWGVVLDRLPRILDLWDPAKPVWPYVKANLHGYLFKHRTRRRHSSEVPEREYTVDHITRIEVLDIMEGLTKDEQTILHCHAVLGWSFNKLAQFLGVSKATARNRYLAVVNRIWSEWEGDY